MTLKVEALTKRFGGLTAVDRVSFCLESNGLTAIVGPNGAGKSTLFNLVSGLIPPSEGRLFFCGEDITGMSIHWRVRSGIGRTFQLVSVFPKLSVQEHMWLSVKKLERGEGIRRECEIADILSQLGLLEKRESPCAALTISEKKRLELAMVLALGPKLLLLDEVFAGLMIEEVEQLRKVVLRLAAEKIILLIEHRMDIVMELASRVLVMVKGALIADGTPDQVRGSSLVQKAYLREEQ
ncbi:MAG: ATP-binding cassette domain-containing protein [Syntrophorhabdales bacterium]